MTIDGKTLSAWDGLYCPENQTLPKLCDAGYYCDSRNGTARKKCPEGSFCPWGSSEPKPCPWPVHCVEGSAQQPVTFFTLLIVMEALIVKIVVSLYGPVKKLYKKAELMVEEALSKDFHPDIRRKHIARMKQARRMASNNEERKQRARRRITVLKTMFVVIADDEQNEHLGMSIKDMQNVAQSSRKSFTAFTTYRMPQKRDRISLEFENLVLTVGNTKKVINGVSGFIEGGEGVAIMGESGAVSTYTCMCMQLQT